MPLRKLSATEAFDNLKTNPYGDWPRVDAPDNRFAAIADPYFKAGFLLEPGQRIFTIGSCFARNIEQALAARGFDIPMIEVARDRYEWGGDPLTMLNTYVPAVVAPQIRWAFGIENFDIDRHAVEVRPGRFVDLQLTSGFRPMPAEKIVARRERIGDVYRKLAQSQVVLMTLGLIEAWYDNKSASHINAAPPKAAAGAERGRFELHIQDYNEVMGSLRELIGLLNQVCPPGYRMILTVSPVPLTATFTDSDVAVANTYSKSVLRAAAGAIVAEFDHVEYFPSYESVALTERAVAYIDDQIHVNQSVVQFNVDRMIRRYVQATETETAGDVIARAREERRAGRRASALRLLQTAWAGDPDNSELTVALADAHLRNGNGAVAEQMLVKHLASHDDAVAGLMLATRYNATGRYLEAAAAAEKAAEAGVSRLSIAEQRIIAYFHLGRYQEGLAILARMRYAPHRAPLFIYWKARFCERLNRLEEAEGFYRDCNGLAENASYMTAYAEFLGARGRWDEVQRWVDRALLTAPTDPAALRLRRENREFLSGSLAGDIRAARRERRLVDLVSGAFKQRLKRARPEEL